MSLETHSLVLPPPPPQPWRSLGDLLRPDAGRAPEFEPALLDAPPGGIAFRLDPASVRTGNEKTGPHNTTYETRGDMTVSGPDGAATQVPVRYEVSLRNDEATCGSSNPVAFRKLREALMMVFVVQKKAYDQLGPLETEAMVAEIRAALAPRFAGKLGGTTAR